MKSSKSWICDIFPFIHSFLNLSPKFCYSIQGFHLLNFIPKYFIFYALINKTYFPFVTVLWQCTKLQIILATSLNSFIRPSRHCVEGMESLGFSTYNTSVNRDNFISSFSIWMPFYFHFIALVRTFNHIFTINGHSQYLSLSPDCWGKAFNLSP